MRIVRIAQQVAAEAHDDPIGWVSSHHPVNLSPAQSEAILAEMARFGKTRPSPSEYAAAERRLLAVPIPVPVYRRRGGGSVNNARKGYDKREVKLLPGFDPRRDLPEGWGLYSMSDGGGNHRIDNAARIAWTSIWNFWSHYVKDGTMGGKFVADSTGEGRWTWDGWEDR